MFELLGSTMCIVLFGRIIVSCTLLHKLVLSLVYIVSILFLLNLEVHKIYTFAIISKPDSTKNRIFTNMVHIALPQGWYIFHLEGKMINDRILHRVSLYQLCLHLPSHCCEDIVTKMDLPLTGAFLYSTNEPLFDIMTISSSSSYLRLDK